MTIVSPSELKMMNIPAFVFFFLYLSMSCAYRPTPYEVDIQVDYLNSLMNAAKLRPLIDGELNFSPNEDEFSNVVKSIAGKRGNIFLIWYRL